MNSGHLNDYCYLDRIRTDEGADKCRAALNDILRKDTRRAVALLNDSRLMFPGLYILREPIERTRIQRYLSLRNRLAIRIVNQIGSADTSGTDYLSSKQDAAYPVLKWILETGAAEEIPDDDYAEILDVTVSVLINIYEDRDILPAVVELIFKRNREGRYIHDLVWALFRVHDPEVLKLIAERIQSADAKDAALAAELLNIDETDVPADGDNREGQYEGYLHWLQENAPYLHFTEESFQYASKPAFSSVDLERKYLQKGVPSYDKQPVSDEDGDAGNSLTVFKQLDDEERKILSRYSQQMHDKSVPAWKEWLNAPISEQIEAAKTGSEGAQ